MAVDEMNTVPARFVLDLPVNWLSATPAASIEDAIASNPSAGASIGHSVLAQVRGLARALGQAGGTAVFGPVSTPVGPRGCGVVTRTVHDVSPDDIELLAARLLEADPVCGAELGAVEFDSGVVGLRLSWRTNKSGSAPWVAEYYLPHPEPSTLVTVLAVSANDPDRAIAQDVADGVVSTARFGFE